MDARRKRRIVRYELPLKQYLSDLPGMGGGCKLVLFQRGCDESLLLALNNQIFSEHPDQGSWNMDTLINKLNETIKFDSDLQILHYEGEPSGFIWLKHHDQSGFAACEIFVMGVLDKLRGLGLGKYLVSSALDVIKKFGYSTAWVYTDESNTRARKLYESFGFRFDFIEEL